VSSLKRAWLGGAPAQGVTIGGKPVKFELLAEEDQADPTLGPLVAQRFVDAKVNGVVAHFNSGVTIPASTVYAGAGIPQLSVSTNPQRWVFFPASGPPTPRSWRLPCNAYSACCWISLATRPVHPV
jgi:hypothetical protein